MKNKVGLTLKAKFDNGRSVSGGGAVFHSERARKEDRLNLKTEPNTITLYRHGLEEVNKKDQKEVYRYFHELENSIKTDYQKHSHRNRKWQAKNELLYEGIIAFGREQFDELNDPKKVMEYCTSYCDLLEQKTGAKIHMISLHLDEGHHEDGEFQHNYHAHFLLVNYNETIHKSALRNAKILVDEYKTETKTYVDKTGETKQKTVKTQQKTGHQIEALYDFKQIQTDLGNHFAPLGFERGRDYKSEGLKCPKNLDHKTFTAQKVAEKQLQVEQLKTIKKSLQPINDFAKTHGIQAKRIGEFTEKLTTLINNKDQEISTKQGIINEFNNFLSNNGLTSLSELDKKYKTTREELKASKQAKQIDYQTLKQTYEDMKNQLIHAISEEIETAKELGFETYEQRLEKNNNSIIKRNLLKGLEKPEKPRFINNKPQEDTIKTINELLEIKQTIENKPIIVDIDENQRLKEELKTKTKKIQRLESENENLKKELSIKTTKLETTNNLLSNQKEKLNTRLERILTLKSEISTHKTQISSLEEEDLAIKSESNALKTAVERFLSLSIRKRITTGTKTLLERFNEAIDKVKTLLVDQAEKPKEQKRESQAVKQAIQENMPSPPSQERNSGGFSR